MVVVVVVLNIKACLLWNMMQLDPMCDRQSWAFGIDHKCEIIEAVMAVDFKVTADGNDRLLQNVSTCVPNYPVSHSKRQYLDCYIIIGLLDSVSYVNGVYEGFIQLTDFKCHLELPCVSNNK
jgi:hypothetical protein